MPADDSAARLRLPPELNYAFLLLVLLSIAAILTAAMVLQYGNGELPCPLCLLERFAMFGICFGIIRNFRHGFSYRNTGYSLLCAIFLLVVAVRQTLLDIYPRPGHAYTGSAVFGLHMPVWSIVVALCVLTAYAVKLSVLGEDASLRDTAIDTFPALARLACVASLYLIALLAVNFVSVVIQCGVGECHTFGYRLFE